CEGLVSQPRWPPSRAAHRRVLRRFRYTYGPLAPSLQPFDRLRLHLRGRTDTSDVVHHRRQFALVEHVWLTREVQVGCPEVHRHALRLPPRTQPGVVVVCMRRDNRVGQLLPECLLQNSARTLVIRPRIDQDAPLRAVDHVHVVVGQLDSFESSHATSLTETRATTVAHRDSAAYDAASRREGVYCRTSSPLAG